MRCDVLLSLGPTALLCTSKRPVIRKKSRERSLETITLLCRSFGHDNAVYALRDARLTSGADACMAAKVSVNHCRQPTLQGIEHQRLRQRPTLTYQHLCSAESAHLPVPATRSLLALARSERCVMSGSTPSDIDRP